MTDTPEGGEAALSPEDLAKQAFLMKWLTGHVTDLTRALFKLVDSTCRELDIAASPTVASILEGTLINTIVTGYANGEMDRAEIDDFMKHLGANLDQYLNEHEAGTLKARGEIN